MRDIDSTVDFVKDLLRNDNSSRNTPDINLPGSYANRSNTNNNERDATNYKHDDARTSGYKSSARHLDRRQVRYEGEDVSSELDSLKRDLENSSAVLDRSADDFAKRTEEDDRLEQELDDLKYRVRRVKDDIEYVSRGKRTPEKDEERRKLERELIFLMHERLPEVEKKIEDREERKRREVREGVRARDKRNETYGRYDRYDGARRSSFDTDRFREEDRGYSRYDDRDRERNGRDSRDRSRDRYDSYESRRPLSPPARDRTPPPVPAEQPKSAITAPPPAPPAPTSIRTSAPSTKNMSPEERAAFIRAQAQERLQARMRALGMVVPESESSTPTVDKSVEERLEREKKEAEEKAKQAEKEQEEREASRKARLQQASSGSATPTQSVKPPAPSAPIKSSMKKAPAPPPPKSRAAPAATVPAPKPAASPAPPQPSAEDEELRAQEEAHKKAMEERRARLQRMREEEEEAQRAEEELLKRRQQANARKVESPAPVAPVALAEQAPVPAPSPSASAKSPPTSNASTNPFHRLHNGSASAASPPQAASTGFNPFFRPPPQTAPVIAKAAEPTPDQVKEESAPPPPPPPPPAPPAPTPAVITRAPTRAPPADEEWDVINEKNNDSDDSSDDDDYAGSRSMRDNLARALFGGGGSKPASKPASPAPVANKAALSKLGGGDTSNVGALFAAIQGGARLKHATTNDRSAAPVSGRVIGDATPPPHISDAPREHAPSPVLATEVAQEENHATADRSANRQSVDWYSGLAADADRSAAEPSGMASVVEAEEPLEGTQAPTTAPTTTHSAQASENDSTSEFDMTTSMWSVIQSAYRTD